MTKTNKMTAVDYARDYYSSIADSYFHLAKAVKADNRADTRTHSITLKLPLSFEGKVYSGYNFIHLLTRSGDFKSPYWATFNALKKVGVDVLKGQHGTRIGFYSERKLDANDPELKKSSTDDNTVVSVPRLGFFKRYTVFNLDQTNNPNFKTCKLPRIAERYSPAALLEDVIKGTAGISSQQWWRACVITDLLQMMLNAAATGKAKCHLADLLATKSDAHGVDELRLDFGGGEMFRSVMHDAVTAYRSMTAAAGSGELKIV